MDPRGEVNKYEVKKSDTGAPEEQAETKTASKGLFGFGVSSIHSEIRSKSLCPDDHHCENLNEARSSL